MMTRSWTERAYPSLTDAAVRTDHRSRSATYVADDCPRLSNGREGRWLPSCSLLPTDSLSYGPLQTTYTVSV